MGQNEVCLLIGFWSFFSENFGAVQLVSSCNRVIDHLLWVFLIQERGFKFSAVRIEIRLACADSPKTVRLAIRYCSLAVPDMAAVEVQILARVRRFPVEISLKSALRNCDSNIQEIYAVRRVGMREGDGRMRKVKSLNKRKKFHFTVLPNHEYIIYIPFVVQWLQTLGCEEVCL